MLFIVAPDWLADDSRLNTGVNLSVNFFVSVCYPCSWDRLQRDSELFKRL